MQRISSSRSLSSTREKVRKKQYRRIATRYDKLGAAFFAFIQTRRRAHLGQIN
jgi:hypothetical protein